MKQNTLTLDRVNRISKAWRAVYIKVEGDGGYEAGPGNTESGVFDMSSSLVELSATSYQQPVV